MHAGGAQALHVGAGGDAAFGDQQALGRHLGQQVQRGFQAHVEAAQVTVVDAHQRGLELERALQLGAVVHFHQHGHIEAEGNGLELGHLGIGQAGGDEQDAVGPHGARFVDLVGIDHEVLAQHRQVAAGARLLQVIRAALEELPVGQHRQAGRAHLAAGIGVADGVALGDVGRHEISPDHALARAGLLDLGNHRGLPRGHLGAQRAHEVAREHAALGIGAHLGQRQLLLRRRHFLALDGDDLVQDVTHLFVAARALRARAPSVS